MEGQVLGNRYEILEKIGGGGMALVYKAKCSLLNRFVALKILRPEFTNDEEFVKRFRIEAQSAASLSHPNVVSIYDVGHEGNIHYIVMEYVDGITLKEYISQKVSLDWSEAVNITIQICSAIEHAHRNHIVHRDIKPHNILLTKEGVAKVTDFGIARAVSSSTITMVGSTIGSVHYFSPEQARGGFIDEKSDLYSLGIALYEMVIGKVPFDGETPVAIALKHIQEEAVQPREIKPEIPIGVNDIIMKAIKKDLSKRYQTASNMLGDLYRVLREPGNDFVLLEDEENSPTRRLNSINSDTIPEKANYSKKSGTGEETTVKKANKLTYWLAGITCAVIILACIFVTYNLVMGNIFNSAPTEFPLENYVNKNYNDIKDDLTTKGIIVRDRRIYDEKRNKDIIISQSVEPGTSLKINGHSVVEFTVSDGPEMVKVPFVKNKDYRDAENILKDKKLVPDTQEEFSDTIGKGMVTRTDPDYNEEVKAGDVVKVFKSKGPELKKVKVPNLIGMTEMEAQKALSDIKLVMGKILPENSSYTGKIIKQNPQPKADALEGSAVDITFETPVPAPVETPSKRYIKQNVTLNDPNKYGDKIKVRVEAVPSDTNAPEILINNEEKNKSDFPLEIIIPVPEKGTTMVRVFFNDAYYYGFTQSPQ